VEMAQIVQAADSRTSWIPIRRPVVFALISHGFPLVTRDDHETAQSASFLYDALYASLKEAKN
jgi:hypothetical protein